jgi:hypothetical protein
VGVACFVLLSIKEDRHDVVQVEPVTRVANCADWSGDVRDQPFDITVGRFDWGEAGSGEGELAARVTGDDRSVIVNHPMMCVAQHDQVPYHCLSAFAVLDHVMGMEMCFAATSVEPAR